MAGKQGASCYIQPSPLSRSSGGGQVGTNTSVTQLSVTRLYDFLDLDLKCLETIYGKVIPYGNRIHKIIISTAGMSW